MRTAAQLDRVDADLQPHHHVHEGVDTPLLPALSVESSVPTCDLLGPDHLCWLYTDWHIRMGIQLHTDGESLGPNCRGDMY